MKKMFLLLSFVCLLSVQAQEKKYQSLLWKIERNDLEKPSFLYGTMHVSERIAFHLSDVFFESLLSTDKIALETNPETWMNEFKLMEREASYRNFYGFYNSFHRKPIENSTLKGLFFLSNYIANNFLYRTTDYAAEYQEDTFLDMFIYQAAKRTNREIVELENFRESTSLVHKASASNYHHEPPGWLRKLSAEKSPIALMEDAYRTKDLDLIDSLNRGMSSPEYLNYMLHIRNENMTRRIDSTINSNTSIFIGIGAAHLPGEKGVIELLRKEGYKVSPLSGEYTETGKDEKERLEKSFIYTDYQTIKSDDKLISFASPSEQLEVNTNNVRFNFSLDLTNGANLNLTRAPSYDFLRKDNYKTDLDRIDSLLYENIPGNILKKERIKIDDLDAFDIQNQTKKGDYQRYMIIISPIETIIMSFIGKGDFVKNQSDKIFESIKIKPLTNSWEKIQTVEGGYSVEIPSFHSIYSNDQYLAANNPPEIIAYDPSDESYYFLIQNKINDTDHLEDTQFEHQQIHRQFYKEIKVDSTNTKYSGGKLTSFYSEGKLNKKKTLRLKSFIKGSHYYLLGSLGGASKTKRFFNSFGFKEFNYTEAQEHTDSIMHFSVNTQVAPRYESNLSYLQKERDKNPFDESQEIKVFNSISGQNIEVLFRRLGSFAYEEDIDSLWNTIIENNKDLHDFEPKSEPVKKVVDGNYQMEINFMKPESSQIIKAKYWVEKNRFYSAKTLVDANYANDDPFVEEFYKTFSPEDTLSDFSLFAKKSDLFFESINSNDSIRKHAFKYTYDVKFDADDFEKLKNTIQNFEFKDSELRYKETLIRKMGKIEHPEAVNFLEEFYKENSERSNIQFAVLNALMENKTEESYKEIIPLMQYDVPFGSSTEIKNLFSSLSENHKYSSDMVPDLFQFSAIPEYQNFIIELSSNLIDSNYLEPQKIAENTKEILTLAKLELKRAKSRYLEEKKNSSAYSRQNSNSFNLLKNYLSVLLPYSTEPEVDDFFEKVDLFEEPSVRLFRVSQKLKQNEEVSNDVLEEIAKENKTRFELYCVLKENNALDKFPKKYDGESIAEAFFVNYSYSYDPEDETHSRELIHKQKASFKDKKYEIFFFKTKGKNPYNQLESEKIQRIAFELDKDGTYVTDTKKVLTEYEIEYFGNKHLKEIYENQTDKVLFHDKKRISFYYY